MLLSKLFPTIYWWERDEQYTVKTNELLEYISVQRHDFLNHLQVISGLVQLNKSDRVRDYIDQVCNEIAELSVVTRLKVPELKAVLLVAVNAAHRCQVKVVFDINTNMEGCRVSGDILGQSVDECINLAFEHLSPPHVKDRRLLLCISESDKKYTVRFGFPGLPSSVVADLENKLKYCRGLIAINIQVGVAVTAERGEIYLVVPK